MTRVKTVAAALLAIALLHPQHTCGRYRGSSGEVVFSVPDGADPGVYRAFREPPYAWEDLAWRQPSTWLPPAISIWPAPLLIFGRRLGGTKAKRARWIVDMMLAATSAYFILLFSDLGQRAAGAFLSVAANGICLVACVAEAGDLWGRPRKSGTGVQGAE